MATTVSRQIKATDPGRVVTVYAGEAILKGILLVYDLNTGNSVFDASNPAMDGLGLADGLAFVGVAKDSYPKNRPGNTGSARASSSQVEIYTAGVFEFNTTGLTSASEWQVVAIKDNDTVRSYVIGNPIETGGVPCGILVEYLGSNKGLVMIAPSRFFQYQDLIV